MSAQETRNSALRHLGEVSNDAYGVGMTILALADAVCDLTSVVREHLAIMSPGGAVDVEWANCRGCGAPTVEGGGICPACMVGAS